MADEIDIQSFDELFDKVRQGTITQEQFNSALRSLSGNTKSAAEGMKHVGRSLQAFAGGLARGNTSMSNLSGVVIDVKNALTAIPGAGKAAGIALDLFGDGLILALEQMDKALGTFYNLGQIGALGADGIDDIRKQMVAMGVPLDQFNKMIAKNTKALVGLTGSASDTAENFANMVGTMRMGLDMDLRLLGFTTEEVGSTLANYANIQRRLGAEQNLNQGRLTAGAVKFGKEMDLLAKVTGTSREQQQSNLDAALREGRYLAATRQLEASGAGAAAQELNKFMLVIQDISPTLGAAIKDTAGGFISTQSAQQGFITTGGALPEIIAGIKSGQLDYASAIQQMQDATKQQLPAMESINLAVGDATGAFVPLNESVNLTTFAMGELENAIERVTALQDAQVAVDPGGVTAELVGAAKSLEEASSKLQATVFSSDLLSGGIENFIDLINAGADLLYGTVGTAGDFSSLADEQRALTNEVMALRKELEILNSTTQRDPKTQELAERLASNRQKDLDRKEARLNALNRKIDANRELGKSITISDRLMDASNTNKGILPYALNRHAMDRYNLDQTLREFGITPTTALTPKVQSDIDQYLKNNITESSESGFKETDKFFEGIKTILEKNIQLINKNIQDSNSSSIKQILEENIQLNKNVQDSNNRLNRAIETLVSETRNANDQRDKQLKHAYNT